MDEDPGYADELRSLGSQGIPTFVKGHDVLIGFQPDRILDMIKEGE